MLQGDTVDTDIVVDSSVQGISAAGGQASLSITLNQLDNAVELGVRTKFVDPVNCHTYS